MSVPAGADVDLDRDRLTAAIDLLRRTGGEGVEIRFSDDNEPTVWMAIVEWRVNKDGRPVPHGAHRAYEAAAALHPLGAVERLLDQVIDGARCKHCGRPSAVDQNWQNPIRARDESGRDVFCVYVYDPELKTYRRSCEGEA